MAGSDRIRSPHSCRNGAVPNDALADWRLSTASNASLSDRHLTARWYQPAPNGFAVGGRL